MIERWRRGRSREEKQKNTRNELKDLVLAAVRRAVRSDLGPRCR